MPENHTKEQINEVQNVLNTLVETTDHLTTLASSEELEQSVYIFASLIEGTEAVFKVILTLDVNVLEQMKKIEKTLIFIAKAMENEALDEVSKEAEHALRPAYKSMIDQFATV